MKRRALSIIAGAILAVVFMPFMSAYAWTASPTNAASFTIARNVNDAPDNVTNTFTYTITAEMSNPATVSNAPESATIEFNSVAPSGGKATQTGIIDFSDAIFTELGDYGFRIRETGSSDSDTYPISNDVYTIWFSVRNVTGNNGVPTGEHSVTFIGVSDASDNKIDLGATDNKIVFSSGIERTYIVIKAYAKGNSADPRECFKIEVHFAAYGDEKYNVITDTTCKNDLALLSATEISGNIVNTVYLRNGETATIGIKDGKYQIPVGIQYAVIVNGAADYKTYIDDSDTDSKTSAVKTAVSIDNPEFEKNNETPVVNVKEITPKTGLDLSLLPFAVIAIIGIAGAILVVKRK